MVFVCKALNSLYQHSADKSLNKVFYILEVLHIPKRKGVSRSSARNVIAS